MQINYDDTNYWIYFSTEKLTCFLCKEEGHLAKFCKNVDPNMQSNLNSPSLSMQQSPSFVVNNETPTINPSENINKTLQVTNSKRPHSSTTDSTSSNFESIPKLTQDDDGFTKATNVKKKVKNAAQASPDNITKLLHPAIKVINDNVKSIP